MKRKIRPYAQNDRERVFVYSGVAPWLHEEFGVTDFGWFIRRGSQAPDSTAKSLERSKAIQGFAVLPNGKKTVVRIQGLVIPSIEKQV